MKKILITGARNWTSATKVARAIADEIGDTPHEEILVIHGDCPLGADSMAKSYCQTSGIPTLAMPATWRDESGRYKPAAGFERNHAMVSMEPDVCLAFYDVCTKHPEQMPHYSHGTDHCATAAESHGVPVKRFYAVEL